VDAPFGAKLLGVAPLKNWIVVAVTETLPVMFAEPEIIVTAEAGPAKAIHRTTLTPRAGNTDFTLNLLVDKSKAILFLL
jgi:hypothetical protein